MKKKTDYLKFIDYEFIQDDKLFKANTDTAFLGMFLDSMKNKSVLDIGTNTGALLLYAHYHGAKYLYGVDIHSRALKTAEKNLAKYSHKSSRPDESIEIFGEFFRHIAIFNNFMKFEK